MNTLLDLIAALAAVTALAAILFAHIRWRESRDVVAVPGAESTKDFTQILRQRKELYRLITIVSFVLMFLIVISYAVIWLKIDSKSVASPGNVDRLVSAIDGIRNALWWGADPARPPPPPPLPLSLVWGVAIGMILLGASLALTNRRMAGFAGGVLVVLGGLSATVRLIDRVAIDNLVGIDRVVFREERLDPASTGLEHWESHHRLVATLDGFPIGCADLDSLDTTDVEMKLNDVMFEWSQLIEQGGSGYVIIIGSADRLPVRTTTAARYDSNVGLAQARAEATKRRMLEIACRGALPHRPEDGEMLTLAKGPAETPLIKHSLGGFPRDRSVKIYLSELMRHSVADTTSDRPAGGTCEPTRHVHWTTICSLLGAGLVLIAYL